MKMKKRVLAGMMMMVLVLATALSVSAAPSKSDSIVESGDSVGYYDIKQDTQAFEGVKTEVKTQMTNLESKKTVSLNDKVDKAIEKKTMVVEFFDLVPIGNKVNAPNHTVTLKVAAMTTGWKNIVVVHYSTARGVWETLEVKNVDYANKEITIYAQDLSPIAIYADVVAPGSQGTSPTTQGMSSTWMLWTAAALIVLGAGVVVSQKKRG